MGLSQHLSRLLREPARLEKMARAAAICAMPGYVSYMEIVTGQGFFMSMTDDQRTDLMGKLGFPHSVMGDPAGHQAFTASDRVCQPFTARDCWLFFSDSEDAVFYSLLCETTAGP